MKKRLLKAMAGRITYQRIFSRLHRLALAGMNYGNGGDFLESGELHAAQYVRDHLAPQFAPYVIFDVGANLGHYSLEIDDVFSGKKTAIYAFEPSEKTYAELTQNTQGRSRINRVNVGIGDVEETLTLYSNKNASGFASVYDRQLDHFGIDMAPVEEIQISTIDQFCQSEQIPRIHFLKLDIEGHEYKALLGAKRMLDAGCIEYIQFEMGGTNIDSRTYFQDFWYLLHKQYTFYRIVRDGLVRINEYRETSEIFSAINYLLERKK